MHGCGRNIFERDVKGIYSKGNELIMKCRGSKFTKFAITLDKEDRLASIFVKCYSQAEQTFKFHLYWRVLSILRGPKLTGLSS
jgi:hypothetical protein